jgi:hypothetical protein
MSDPCIYIFEANGVFAMIALYVDDIPVACNNTAWRVALTALVRSGFDIKDRGDMSSLIKAICLTSLECTLPGT